MPTNAPLQKVSILIPAYNEERTIRSVVEAVRAVKYPCEREIIVVNDGSKDRTRSVLEEMTGTPELKVIHQENQGKGGALRTGLSAATGDVVIIQDADLELSPDNHPLLLGPFINHGADVVFGSRFLGRKYRTRSWKIRWLTFTANKILTTTAFLLYWRKITDLMTGYKVLSREIYDLGGKGRYFDSNGFDFEPEMYARVCRYGKTIVEVPVTYIPRNFDEGKKITWKDFFRVMRTLFIYRFKRL